MSDKPPDKTKEFVPKEIFEKELHLMYSQVKEARHHWTKQKINEVLDFIEERQLKWSKKKINDTLHYVVDNQMPSFLPEMPAPYNYGGTIVTYSKRSSYDHDYNYLIDVHLSTNHGNLDRMISYIKEKKKIIPKPAIITFIKLCKYCRETHLKKTDAMKKPKPLLKPAVVHLIDLQHEPVNDFKWILHYRDIYLQHSVLLPLLTNHVDEIAFALLNCFMHTGNPSILYSDGSDLMTEVHKKLLERSPICKFLEFQKWPKSAIDKICEDIMKLIQDWLVEHESLNWLYAIHPIQCKLMCFFDGTGTSTYNKESTNSTDNNTEVGAKTLDEKAKLKDQDINIDKNGGTDILTNALGDLNLALSE